MEGSIIKRTRGHGVYADVLRAVVDGGCTWRDVSSRSGLETTTARRVLHVMEDMGLIHVADYRRVAAGIRTELLAVYAFGRGERAPWPGDGRPRRHGRITRPKVELVSFVHAIRVLMAGPHLGKTLAEETGLSPNTCSALLRKLHALRLIYISEYQERALSGLGYPMYEWGPGERDVKKPAPLTDKQLWDKHNAIKRQRKAHLAALHALAANSSNFEKVAA